jgi:hypothetical protein
MICNFLSNKNAALEHIRSKTSKILTVLPSGKGGNDRTSHCMMSGSSYYLAGNGLYRIIARAADNP